MTYTVYHIHVEPDLTTGYVGITKNLTLRFSQHSGKRKQSNPHLRAALKKYGETVKYSIISSGLDYDTACWIEKMLRPFPNMGWNISVGGDVPPNPKGKTRSAEYRANIAKAKLGANNPMFGKKITFSNEHRQKLSEASRKPKPSMRGKARNHLTCPHCGKTGGDGAMTRWHFDRCKYAS